MQTRSILLLGLTSLLLLSACKTIDGGSSSRSSDGGGGPKCSVDEDSWAGHMGLQLRDAAGGAQISCVTEGEGLHPIGLKSGDVIVGLNNNVAVGSVADFESGATKLANARAKDRILHWEFKINRNGQIVTVAPKSTYPGCGLFSYSDCGPLLQ